MKLTKKIALIVCAVLALFWITSCTATVESAPSESVSVEATASAEKATAKIATLAGPTGMGMVKLMESNENKTSANKYEFTVATSPDEIVGLISSGGADIAAIPANLAATLYAKTKGGVQMAAINTLSVLYLVQTGKTIASISDLAGKTIAASGQGSTPEYVLNYILAANGLTDKVTVNYYSEHNEVVTMLATGKADIALLPEPYVTIAQNKVSGLTIALNMNDEWESACKITGDSGIISMGCIAVRTEFAKENPDVVNSFLNEYYTSIEYVNNNVDQAAELIVKYGIMSDKTLAAAAVPNCNIVYIDGVNMKDSIASFFNVLYKAQPASVGGALPGNDFYYIK